MTAPRRRWFQFSLGTLFVLVAVIGTALGWLGNKARVQRAARVEVEGAGGEMLYDWQTNAVEIDPFTGSPVKPTNLLWLRSVIGDDFFDTMMGAKLRGERVTGRIMDRVASLPYVEVLIIESDAISDNDLAIVANMHNLHILHIESDSITDAGVTRAIKSLAQLQSLTLRGAGLRDGSLEAIAELRELEQLEISYTHITDSGVKLLPNTSKLEVLYLDETDVGDSGLLHLADLPHLVQVRVCRTLVTADGVKAFEALRPGCVCVWDSR